MNEQKSTAEPGREPEGGGPSESDRGAPGGSSGSGGYGKGQNQQFHQGQERDEPRPSDGLSRGERFDEQQGGGRDSASVSADEDELRADQAAHQDRGQSDAEAEVDDR